VSIINVDYRTGHCQSLPSLTITGLVHLPNILNILVFCFGVCLCVQAGQTAVHITALFGHEEVLKKLLLFGVEIDDRDSVGLVRVYLLVKYNKNGI